jgi:threonine/homoserine/homoserine lactone efflux protein
MGYYKHIISKAISYTFARMTIYLTIFNFCLLCFWMYDNTQIGDWMKEENLRAGDLILVVIFSLFAISALEYILIGRNKSEVE